MSDRRINQLRVAIADSNPPIWRRLLIPSNTTLEDLHRILQITLGWRNLSPYHYRLRQRRSDTEPVLLKMPLSEIFRDDLTTITYVYDPRDGWFHTLQLEMVLPADAQGIYPHCVAGERACPPEGSGGVWGYEELLDLLDDPSHPEYMTRWDQIGSDFDPETFSTDLVNIQLQAGA